MWPDLDVARGTGGDDSAQKVKALAQLLSQLCGALLLSALDGGQATAANAPPHAKLKEVGDTVELGRHPWLQLAGILGGLHEVKQLGLDAFTGPKLNQTLQMNLTEIVIQAQEGAGILHLLTFLLGKGSTQEGVEGLHSSLT